MRIKDRYRMKMEENIFLAKRNLVDYIWKSANLEGIAVTYPQTEVIFDGLSVNGVKIKDINAIVNLKTAWKFVLENVDYPVDIRFISQVNKLVGEYDIVPFGGKLRTTEVKMGGTDWKPKIPQKEEIERKIDEILKISNATDRALTMMLYLMRTQPFYDGNKRTAMMVGNLIMIKNGVGIISIPIEKQVEFRKLLIEYYESDNMEKLKLFLYDNCIEGMQFPKDEDENQE